jgi:hypothetical protein
MVLLDARQEQKPSTKTAKVDQPIGKPATYENDGEGGLRKKTKRKGDSPIVAKTHGPDYSAEVKYGRACIACQLVAEQLREAERVRDTAFVELWATSNRGDQRPEGCRHDPLDDDYHDVEEPSTATEAGVHASLQLAETLKMSSTTDPPTEVPGPSDSSDSPDLPAVTTPADPLGPLTGSDWRSVTTEQAEIPEAMCILLRDQKNEGDSITTIGQLVDFTQTYELTSLARIGQKKSDTIVKAMVKFWEENPEMGKAYLEEFPVEASGANEAQ